MLIACVQTDVTFADVSANLQRVLDWLEKAGQAGADLVVLPECMLSGYAYDSREQALPHAISIDDPLFNELAKAASKHDLYLTLGFLEQDGERLFNAAALVGPDGVIGHYRKIHLPHLGIDRFVDRGDIPYRVLSAGDVKVGLAICYDSSFPEPIRLLALEGADVIALGTNWPTRQRERPRSYRQHGAWKITCFLLRPIASARKTDSDFAVAVRSAAPMPWCSPKPMATKRQSCTRKSIQQRPAINASNEPPAPT